MHPAKSFPSVCPSVCVCLFFHVTRWIKMHCVFNIAVLGNLKLMPSQGCCAAKLLIGSWNSLCVLCGAIRRFDLSRNDLGKHAITCIWATFFLGLSVHIALFTSPTHPSPLPPSLLRLCRRKTIVLLALPPSIIMSLDLLALTRNPRRSFWIVLSFFCPGYSSSYSFVSKQTLLPVPIVKLIFSLSDYSFYPSIIDFK